ncbi:flavin-containing monooxygenase [Streptomyces sp. NPDC096094]|uniref:flavin-containing monooxygenase n=1 Tax=Streptomyces sp. NPDC096094 TaxID=3366073 RepID=UPI0037F6F23C
MYGGETASGRAGEKAGEAGGSWRDNTYPGVACDVASRFYCYSFALSAAWQYRFAPGHEVRQYLLDTAATFRLQGHIRTHSEVVEGRWQQGRWRLRLADGGLDDVDVLVAATGVLRVPHTPDFKGQDRFRGPVFHSAAWDHDAALTDARIAVIGNGSSGVQITTALAGRTEHLHLFQRTPQWIFPVPNRKVSPPSGR